MTKKSAKQPKIAATEIHETGFGLASGGGFMVGQGFGDARVADGEKLGRGEAFEISPDADAADAENGGQRPDQAGAEERPRRAFRVLERRENIEADVDEEKNQVPLRNELDAAVNDLVAVGKQVAEGEEEIQKEQGHSNPPPIARLALVEPEGLLGDVGVPDEEVLAKVHVGPEN